MSVRIHQLVTGEIEMSLGAALLNEGVTPARSREDVRPFGFSADAPVGGGEVKGFVPAPVWYVEGASCKILIDSGLNLAGGAAAILAAHGATGLFRTTVEHDPVRALAAIDVHPDDVDVVVLTHLHFDHCGYNQLFTRAAILVQQEELSLGIAPPAYAPFYLPEFASRITNVIKQIEVIDGDYRLDSTVRLLRLGGHSPGCMGVIVETGSTNIALAGDVIPNYLNLELDWPTGVFWSLREVLDAHRRLRDEADVIVPNHDWKVREIWKDGVIE